MVRHSPKRLLRWGRPVRSMGGRLLNHICLTPSMWRWMWLWGWAWRAANRNRSLVLLYRLMPIKDKLTSRLSLPQAFATFRNLLKLPDGETIAHRPLKSLRDVSARYALTYHETAPAGIAFTALPCRVVGENDKRPLDCITRTLFFACLPDAQICGHSALIGFQGDVLLDFQSQELERVDDQLTLDPQVLQASKNSVWISSSPVAAELDEAFTLVGPNSAAFGHWIWEYLPKYVAATMSAEISHVPVLVDADMPKTHKQFLRLLLPADTEIVEVDIFSTIRVRKLWVAPTLCYVPLNFKTIDPFWPAYLVAPPDRFAATFQEMWRRVEHALPASRGPERVYLARKTHQHRKLSNEAAINAIIQEHGFTLVYPQDLDFVDQLRLVRDARYIIGTEGSALFLGFFARPAAKLCVLSPQLMFMLTTYTCLLEALSIETAILTGPIVKQRPPYLHFSDYSIPETALRTFLEDWCGPGIGYAAAGRSV